MRKILKIVLVIAIPLLVAIFTDHLLEIGKGSKPFRDEGITAPKVETILADVEAALANPRWTLPDQTNAHNVLKQHVQFLLQYGFVDELEGLSQEIREKDLRMPSGQSYRDIFYQSATSISIGIEDTYINFFRYWAKEKTDSPTAYIALAAGYLKWAWHARSKGDNTVNEVGKPVSFGARLQQAKLALEKAEDLSDEDPYLYVTRMWTNLGLGKRGSLKGDFKQAARLDPQCYDAYLARAVSLLPDNGGEPGEWTEFARTIGPEFRPDNGNSLFAEIVTNVGLLYAANEVGFKADRFYSNVIDWPELNEAFRDFTNAQPNSAYVLNRYARMAFEAGDPDVVAHLTKRLGDQIDKSAIRNTWLWQAYKDYGRLPKKLVNAKPVKVIYNEPYESSLDVTFSHDGRMMAIGDFNGHVTVWNMQTLRQIRQLPAHGLPATSLAFSRDNRLLGVAHGVFHPEAEHHGRGRVIFYDTATWSAKRSIPTALMASSINFTDDGRHALVTGFHGRFEKPAELYIISLTDFSVASKSHGIRAQFRRPMLLTDPPGNIFAVLGHTMIQMPPRSTNFNATCVGTNNTGVTCYSTIWDYEVSPDRSLLAISRGPNGEEDFASGRIDLWRWGSLEPVNFVGDDTIAGMTAIAWSPDGKYLFAGGHDEAISIWDAKTLTKKAILFGHRGTIFGLTMSPDRKHLASAGQDGSVMLWDIPKLTADL